MAAPTKVPRDTRSWESVQGRPSYSDELCHVVQVVAGEARVGDLAPAGRHRTPFDQDPTISFHDCVIRMVKYTYVSEPVYFLACIHLGQCPIPVNSRSVQLLYMVICSVLSKYQDEFLTSNTVFAAMAEVPLREFNRLEGVFLGAIDWQVKVDPEYYSSFRSKLRKWGRQRSEPLLQPSPPSAPPARTADEGLTWGSTTSLGVSLPPADAFPRRHHFKQRLNDSANSTAYSGSSRTPLTPCPPPSKSGNGAFSGRFGKSNDAAVSISVSSSSGSSANLFRVRCASFAPSDSTCDSTARCNLHPRAEL